MNQEVRERIKAVELTMRSGELCINCGEPLLTFEEELCCECGG